MPVLLQSRDTIAPYRSISGHDTGGIRRNLGGNADRNAFRFVGRDGPTAGRSIGSATATGRTSWNCWLVLTEAPSSSRVAAPAAEVSNGRRPRHPGVDSMRTVHVSLIPGSGRFSCFPAAG